MTSTLYTCDMLGVRDEYIEYLKESKKCSQNTLLAYIRDIEKFFVFAEMSAITTFAEVDVADVKAYKGYLARNGLSSPSVSRALSALRSMLQYLVAKGELDCNPAKEVHNDKASKSMPNVLTNAEVEKLLSQPSGADPKSVRDKAILELLYATGIRVSELIDLNVSDINLQFSLLHCSAGEKERIIPLYPIALKAVAEYINGARKMLVYKSDEEALFVNIAGERMTRQGLWKIIKQYAFNANITTPITPHTLRHSFAAHLLENGADIHDIQEILGHTDISSTQRYANYLKSYHKKNYIRYHPRA